MKFVQAQFSLKYEPQIKIRRNINQIEDFLEELYGTPQTIPIPDDFAAEAPRIVLNSKNGHSQISFSQISVDFTVNFDGEYTKNFELTKDYLLHRIAILKELVEKIGINKYYFCGISYNVHLNTQGRSSVDYLKNIFGQNLDRKENIYDVSQRVASIVEDKYFVNSQIGTFREFQGRGGNIPELLAFSNSKVIAEGVNLALDINNRYEYLCVGSEKDFCDFDSAINKIYELIELNLSEWR